MVASGRWQSERSRLACDAQSSRPVARAGRELPRARSAPEGPCVVLRRRLVLLAPPAAGLLERQGEPSGSEEEFNEVEVVLDEVGGDAGQGVMPFLGST